MDEAHRAAHELNLQVHECGDEADCDGVQGTSALEVVAWAVEHEDEVDAGPGTEDNLIISFGDGGILVTEFYPESGRLRSWTVR